MSEAIYRQGNTVNRDRTPSAAVLAGEIVVIEDRRMGVWSVAKAADELGAVLLDGVFDVLSASATLFSVGEPVYWDASASLAIKAPGDPLDLFLGPCLVAKVSGDLTVRTDLNATSADDAQEALTTAAPAASTYGTSTIDSTSNAVDATLGSGAYIGQMKMFVMTEASNSSTVTIALHVTSDPEVATFNAVDEFGLFIWTGTEWDTVLATCTFV